MSRRSRRNRSTTPAAPGGAPYRRSRATSAPPKGIAVGDLGVRPEHQA